MELTFAVDKDSSFQKALERAYELTSDLTIPLRLIAQSWFKSNRSIFDPSRKSEGRYKDLSERPVNAYWEKDPGLRQAYAEGGYKAYKKAKYGFVYPVLYRTGKLARSITDPLDTNAIHLILDKKTLILGTKVPYGVYHQSQQGRMKMPYRPFLFIGVEQIAPHDIKQTRLKSFITILENYVVQAIKGNIKKGQE